MEMNSWTCLMVEKGPGIISDEVANALMIAACDLYLKKWDTMHIVSDVCEGIIETSWNTQMVGIRSGILFRTEIVSDTGPYQVNFLLSIEDLERGAEALREMEERSGIPWGFSTETYPIPELYEFHDLGRKGSRTLQ